MQLAYEWAWEADAGSCNGLCQGQVEHVERSKGESPVQPMPDCVLAWALGGSSILDLKWL